MIVVDASAVVLGLLNDADARRYLASEAVAVPHLADSEVVSSMRSHVRRGTVTEPQAKKAIDCWMRLGIRRFGVVDLLPRMWELCHNLTAYDASYVALAEAIGGQLLTADRRLAGAAGPMCPIVVVRR